MMGRIRHRRTKAPGDAVAQFTGREGTVFPGPWSRVQFDDGLECWCPDDELEACAPASDASVRDDCNATIDALVRLADAVDRRYSWECADSGCTNPEPDSDRRRLVRLLHRTALSLNASGLGDSGGFERYVEY